MMITYSATGSGLQTATAGMLEYYTVFTVTPYGIYRMIAAVCLPTQYFAAIYMHCYRKSPAPDTFTVTLYYL